MEKAYGIFGSESQGIYLEGNEDSQMDNAEMVGRLQQSAYELQERQKRERRSKDEADERNYVCGCGKSYLSYAALYTHAKTKHNGIFPDGTNNLQKKAKNPSSGNTWQVDSQNCDLLRTYEFNKDFKEFANLVGGQSSSNRRSTFEIILDFPWKFFVDENDYRELVVSLEKIRIELEAIYGGDFLDQMDIIVYEINNHKELSGYNTTALFLIYIFRFVNPQLYQEICIFCVLYLKMMNDNGYDNRDMTQVLFNVPCEQSRSYCSVETADAFPQFSNFFIKEYFQLCFEKNQIFFQEMQLKHLGLETNELLVLILLVQKFSDWLGIQKFSNYYIELYKD